MLSNLDAIADRIRVRFDALDAAREAAYVASRQVTRAASVAIKNAHREDYDHARTQLAECAALTRQMLDAVAETPELRYGGFIGDAEKEYAEAAITLAGIMGEPLPDPESLGVEFAPWLNGLAEVIGEYRRHVLDLVRRENVADAERYLELMDDMYQAAMTFDYPNAISLGLRSRCDAARGMIERTRGDLTTAQRQARLEAGMKQLQESLGVPASTAAPEPLSVDFEDAAE